MTKNKSSHNSSPKIINKVINDKNTISDHVTSITMTFLVRPIIKIRIKSACLSLSKPITSVVPKRSFVAVVVTLGTGWCSVKHSSNRPNIPKGNLTLISHELIDGSHRRSC